MTPVNKSPGERYILPQVSPYLNAINIYIDRYLDFHSIILCYYKFINPLSANELL